MRTKHCGDCFTSRPHVSRYVVPLKLIQCCMSVISQIIKNLKAIPCLYFVLNSYFYPHPLQQSSVLALSPSSTSVTPNGQSCQLSQTIITLFLTWCFLNFKHSHTTAIIFHILYTTCTIICLIVSLNQLNKN